MRMAVAGLESAFTTKTQVIWGRHGSVMRVASASDFTQSMTLWPMNGESDLSIEEAAERLLCAFLLDFADREDTDLIPLRSFMEEAAKLCNVSDFDSSVVPEWEYIGLLRERTRLARQRLAEGEEI